MNGNTMDLFQIIVAIIFLVIFVVVALFDLYVSALGFPDKTISYVLREYGKQHPSLVLLCGFILGHIWG